ncbi:MAG: hypothetical protein JWP44_4837, partial [Mucilaginibacter sp.]|nr:hypothetical protein [Mucilaginibacter sp.]
AEIEATIAEFNRLAMLATSMHAEVKAVVAPLRPFQKVQVVAAL